MPSLKSSSKTGDSIVLFATERRALKSAMETLQWIHAKGDEPELTDPCAAAFDAIQKVLKHIPEPEKTKPAPGEQDKKPQIAKTW